MLKTALIKNTWLDLARIDVDYFEGEEYLGTATVEVTDENSVMIWDVEVDRHFRGMGYGTKMMAELISFIYSNIMLTRKIELFVSKKNISAIRCYEKSGFKIMPRNYSSEFLRCLETSYLMQYIKEE